MLKTNGFGKTRTFFRINVLFALVLAVALPSCAKTKVMNAWRDPAYTGRPQKILIHTVGRDPTVKTMFENQLVERLKEHGVDALAGHDYLPDTLIVNGEAIRKLAQEKGMDAVFIAGPTNRKNLESLRPGEMSYATTVFEGQLKDYNTFETFVNGAVYSAGTYAGEEISMEMSLYDAKTKKRIWSTLSRSRVWDSAVDEVKPAVDRAVEMLAKEKIIP